MVESKAESKGFCGQQADTNEPNNEIGDATEIQLTQPVNAYIFPAQDGDFYKI